MNSQQFLLERAEMLIARIERISADSTWARRSSGHRGTLLKWIEKVKVMDTTCGEKLSPEELADFNNLIEIGYAFLSEAVREKFY